MARLTLLSPLFACCIVACHVVSAGFTSDEGASGQTSEGGSAGRTRGGSGGTAGKKASAQAGEADGGVGTGGEGGVSSGGDAGVVQGGGNAAGGFSTADGGSAGANAGSSGEGGEAGSQCSGELGCANHCEGDPEATCTVLSANPCEFAAFVGVTRKVACGQKLVVGTTNCGGCGMVNVELFFDGSRCWQGVPQCALPELAGKYILPRKP